ncbi:tRNA uracil 4-sulfurtransferase ThiI [Lactiplantibacillus mudanjiangensis]|uniref:Probable tRNA sulfurtransferase n=1 Tax=Lactiplantibacillus mudanjiangensis TaxID=1296538 RepID=A0A660E2T6_9LACO|nr:tRNA uracil 4-sulfurtransferase ThiI [Lactiplantibacillus mudanjiangensis]VDG19177.1 thiamine biosynthesis protein ThiI [Lactobacillus plantarum JDM1] [Lactiplantibacillus mudanjiangensis]VDG25658.1 thiamine biosynthesis protein ThiI [Lactobacillus plantarum JDM1] [Lactiplantibacillus mudanjiangensis]VDG29945.1 thiamine biosynthesis protein ThiI [Lactobacillus plantarum JDM1] [Lactiplantibacillus mudanjiangensis]VDG33247.1 thiamine biosynthesis protein ThiI [Lactobacillus plantarum JDM1] [La
MQYTEIMVRYGELSTKGKNRRNFIDSLGRNVRKALHDFPTLKVHADRDRMHISLNDEPATDVIERLKLVFGIQNFSPSIRVAQDMDEVYATAIEMMKAQFKPGMTFKVNTRRSDHHFEYDTNEINDMLGGKILENVDGIKVQMKQPDVIIRVEVRMNGIFLSSETIQGAGGLPVGTAGKGMLMLSGGIDSPVAGYLGMKRGVDMEMVHFFSPPYTSEQALAKAKQLASTLASYSGSVKFIQIPFTEIQEEIKEKVPEGYLMTVQRRLMMRLMDAVTRDRHGKAIFNGESLGQVASQTMDSMIAINDVTTLPVLRPVISMDKTEIIKIAENIDTYNLSIMPFEDCCTIFAPPAPKTHPKLDRSRSYEERIDVEGLMQRALDGIKISEIKPGEDYMNAQADVFAELL